MHTQNMQKLCNSEKSKVILILKTCRKMDCSNCPHHQYHLSINVQILISIKQSSLDKHLVINRQMVLSGSSIHMALYTKVAAIRKAHMVGGGSTWTVVNAQLVGSTIVIWSVTAEFSTKMVLYVKKGGSKRTS